MNDLEIKLNTPKNLSKFVGQFVLFFSEDKDPQVLFNTVIAEEAFKRAEQIKKEQGRDPVVLRVQEQGDNIISQITTAKL